MYTPDATQQILSEMANQTLKKVNFWCVDKGALPLITPINPYLGQNVWKNGPLFKCQSIYTYFVIIKFGVKYGPMAPRAIYDRGG